MTRGSKARGSPEGTGRKPATEGEANLEGFASAARQQERRNMKFRLPRGRVSRGSETLVVKIADTSLLEKAGSNPAFDCHVPWNWPRKGQCVAGSGLCKQALR
jgi:hypothetical protein